MAEAWRSNVAPRFYRFDDLGFVLLYNCKVGTRTFRKVYTQVYGSEPRDEAHIPNRQNLDEVAQLPIRALFVRNPVDRIVSAYKFFKNLNDMFWNSNRHFPTSTAMRGWLENRHTFTFSEFVEGAINEFPTDKHIAPQYGVHEGIANFVWPFEDVAHGWLKLCDAVPVLPWELPHENRSRGERPMIDGPTADLISEFYKDDINWWVDVSSKAKLCTS